MALRSAGLRPVAALLFLLGCAGGAPAPAPAPAVSAAQAPAPVAALADASASSDGGATANPWPYQTPVVVRGASGMVVTDNAIASNVGRDVLATGGNAADAAVATAFALAVAYPTAGNIGGGGFAVTRMRGEVRALDFRETAPAAATRDMFLSADGKPKPEARDGIKSVGVPGSVAGLWELHRTLGSKKKTWKELLAPAIKLAREGFVVDDAFLATLEFGAKRLEKHPVSAALFLPGGAPPAKGSTFKNPELATVLERIEKGPSGFYEGPTAAALVKQMKEEGGLITLADLKKYQAKWREAGRVRVPRPQGHVDAAAVVGRRHPRDDRAHPRGLRARQARAPVARAAPLRVRGDAPRVRRAEREARRSRLREDAPRRAAL